MSKIRNYSCILEIWLPTILYMNKKDNVKNCLLFKYFIFVKDYLKRDKRYIKLEIDRSFKIYHNLFGYRSTINSSISNITGRIKLIK